MWIQMINYVVNSHHQTTVLLADRKPAVKAHLMTREALYLWIPENSVRICLRHHSKNNQVNLPYKHTQTD